MEKLSVRLFEIPMKSLTLFLFLFVFVPFGQAKQPITIYLAGDSTMADKLAEKRPETGWGEMLQQFFASEDVRVEAKRDHGCSRCVDGHRQSNRRATPARSEVPCRPG